MKLLTETQVKKLYFYPSYDPASSPKNASLLLFSFRFTAIRLVPFSMKYLGIRFEEPKNISSAGTETNHLEKVVGYESFSETPPPYAHSVKGSRD